MSRDFFFFAILMVWHNCQTFCTVKMIGTSFTISVCFYCPRKLQKTESSSHDLHFHRPFMGQNIYIAFNWTEMNEKKKFQRHDSNSGVTSSSCEVLTLQNCSKEEMWLKNCFKTKLKLNWKGVCVSVWCTLAANPRCNIYRPRTHLNSQTLFSGSCWIFFLRVLVIIH